MFGVFFLFSRHTHGRDHRGYARCVSLKYQRDGELGGQTLQNIKDQKKQTEYRVTKK